MAYSFLLVIYNESMYITIQSTIAVDFMLYKI